LRRSREKAGTINVGTFLLHNHERFFQRKRRRIKAYCRIALLVLIEGKAFFSLQPSAFSLLRVFNTPKYSYVTNLQLQRNKKPRALLMRRASPLLARAHAPFPAARRGAAHLAPRALPLVTDTAGREFQRAKGPFVAPATGHVPVVAEVAAVTLARLAPAPVRVVHARRHIANTAVLQVLFVAGVPSARGTEIHFADVAPLQPLLSLAVHASRFFPGHRPLHPLPLLVALFARAQERRARGRSFPCTLRTDEDSTANASFLPPTPPTPSAHRRTPRT